MQEIFKRVEKKYNVTAEQKRQILDKCDVMVDGPFILALRDQDLAFRGS